MSYSACFAGGLSTPLTVTETDTGMLTRRAPTCMSTWAIHAYVAVVAVVNSQVLTAQSAYEALGHA